MSRIWRKHTRRVLAKRIIGEIREHPGNAGRVNTALLRAVGWQIRKRVVPQTSARIHAYGLDLRLPMESGSLSNLHYFGEAFEWQAVNFVRAFCREGDVVVDAGANIGMFTYMACEVVGRTGRVVSFEPLSEAAMVIQANAERNALSVEVHSLATSDAAGWATFTDDVDVSNSLTTDPARPGRSTRRVRTGRIDAYVTSPVTLVKVDVEGAETQAMRGCSGFVEGDYKPVIIAEIHDHSLRRLGTSRDELIALLDGWGYVPVHYDVARRDIVQGAWKTSTADQICVPLSQIDDVRVRLQG